MRCRCLFFALCQTCLSSKVSKRTTLSVDAEARPCSVRLVLNCCLRPCGLRICGPPDHQSFWFHRFRGPCAAVLVSVLQPRRSPSSRPSESRPHCCGGVLQWAMGCVGSVHLGRMRRDHSSGRHMARCFDRGPRTRSRDISTGGGNGGVHVGAEYDKRNVGVPHGTPTSPEVQGVVHLIS